MLAVDGKTSQGETGAVVAVERIRGVRRIRFEQIGRQQRRDYYHDDARTWRGWPKGLAEQYAQSEGGGGRSFE